MPILLPPFTLLGLLSEVKPHSENTIWKAMTLFFSLGALASIKLNFVAHFCITLFGLAVRGKASNGIPCIGHSALWEPQGTI